jgi:hypothetical protein
MPEETWTKIQKRKTIKMMLKTGPKQEAKT